MSNNINTSNPYLYLNTYMNTNSILSTDPLIDSADTSNTDSLISDISGDSIQISPDALAASKNSSSNDMFSSVLDSLVSSGTITQDQKNSITDAFKSARNSFPTYSNGSKGGSQSPLNQLVSGGTITNDQKSAIKEALVSARKSSHHHHSHKLSGQSQSQPDNSISSSNDTDTNESINTKLDSLVKAGTINQNQEDAIEQLLDSSATDTSN
jgi:polyhydroxyalkanoate synthesis regulator phasin